MVQIYTFFFELSTKNHFFVDNSLHLFCDNTFECASATLPITFRRLGEVAFFELAAMLSSGMTLISSKFTRGQVAILPNR
jgi:hypothetical protein